MSACENIAHVKGAASDKYFHTKSNHQLDILEVIYLDSTQSSNGINDIKSRINIVEFRIQS